MTISERTILKLFFWGCGIIGGMTLAIGLGVESTTASALGTMLLASALLVGFLWSVQACLSFLRDYGLGEGTAQLYGEAHATRIFGEDYRRPTDD
ncbi:hypothetical protein TRM7615_03957 [Falsiruegeria mediterranea M17]|uniref:Uncharacterized protein n=1 Tax=Falsiruegeria mediterranea M17 TaxID=1200281 RepID=A0A2R8CDE5_9RHOB|nr:hypothetical protein TRM7615_03957 [Falsiruegeria mediterranea M17]